MLSVCRGFILLRHFLPGNYKICKSSFRQRFRLTPAGGEDVSKIVRAAARVVGRAVGRHEPPPVAQQSVLQLGHQRRPSRRQVHVLSRVAGEVKQPGGAVARPAVLADLAVPGRLQFGRRQRPQLGDARLRVPAVLVARVAPDQLEIPHADRRAQPFFHVDVVDELGAWARVTA